MASIDTECGAEPLESDSFKRMFNFVKLNGALIDFIRNSTEFSFDEFKENCKSVIEEGIKVRDSYVNEMKCLAEHETKIKGFRLIDRIVEIIGYWCKLDQETKETFFSNATLGCLKKVGMQLDDCIGHYWNETATPNRDYCK